MKKKRLTEGRPKRRKPTAEEEIQQLQRRIQELKTAARNATKQGHPHVAGDLKVQANELQRALDKLRGIERPPAKVRGTKLTMEEDSGRVPAHQLGADGYALQQELDEKGIEIDPDTGEFILPEDLGPEASRAAGIEGVARHADALPLKLKTNRHLTAGFTSNGTEQIELRITHAELVYLIYRVNTDEPIPGFDTGSLKHGLKLYLEDAETALDSVRPYLDAHHG